MDDEQAPAMFAEIARLRAEAEGHEIIEAETRRQRDAAVSALETSQVTERAAVERCEALHEDNARLRAEVERLTAELAAWRSGNPSDDLWRVRCEQAEALAERQARALAAGPAALRGTPWPERLRFAAAELVDAAQRQALRGET